MVLKLRSIVRCFVCGCPFAFIGAVWIKCPNEGCRCYASAYFASLDIGDRWLVKRWQEGRSAADG